MHVSALANWIGVPSVGAPDNRCSVSPSRSLPYFTLPRSFIYCVSSHDVHHSLFVICCCRAL